MQVRIRPDLIKKLRAIMEAKNRSGAFIVAQLLEKTNIPAHVAIGKNPEVHPARSQAPRALFSNKKV